VTLESSCNLLKTELMSYFCVSPKPSDGFKYSVANI